MLIGTDVDEKLCHCLRRRFPRVSPPFLFFRLALFDWSRCLLGDSESSPSAPNCTPAPARLGGGLAEEEGSKARFE